MERIVTIKLLLHDLRELGGPSVSIEAVLDAFGWIVKDEVAKNLVSQDEFKQLWGTASWALFLAGKARNTGRPWTDLELLAITDLVVQNYGVFVRGPIPIDVKLQMLPPLKEYKCKALGCIASTNLELDHIRPTSRGGKSIPSNLRWLCHMHNARKGKKRLVAY